ncbi:MAG: hypothetical protein ACOYT8_06780 [Candidatus Dependentiae bacterium]
MISKKLQLFAFITFLSFNLSATNNFVYWHTTHYIAPLEKTSLKWLTHQYYRTRQFTQLKKVAKDRNYYIALVQDHLNYLKRKKDAAKPWAYSECWRVTKNAGILTSIILGIQALIEVGYRKKFLDSYDRANGHGYCSVINILIALLAAPNLKKWFTYSKRLDYRIARDTDMLNCLQQSQ